jgi:hypothetical protein
MIYSTRLIATIKFFYMKKVLALFLIFSLIPIGTSYSQELVDKEPTLGIALTSFSPFNYKAEDGSTIILGEVENRKNFPVSGVKIWAGFYDNIGKNPLESTIGTTILEVIPPFGKSPYMIKSPSSNSAITSVSVTLLGFNSSPEKKPKLSLVLDTLEIVDKLSLSGKLTNNGDLNATNTKIHLISYDAFVPPRVLGIATIELDNKLESGGTDDFEIAAPYDSRASAFKIVAESVNYSTGLIDVTDTTVSALTKLVSINDIGIMDSEGNRMSDITTNTPVNIQSTILLQYSKDKDSLTQPYVYWVQIKKSVEVDGKTKSFVEFIGKAEGIFTSAGQQIPSVEWTPQNEGLYFVETFVWDPVSLPLASKGPISLILVN